MKNISKPEYSPKVTAMYESVIDLMNEGHDMNSIKVADITKRAGIGKGTAYEYFSSKEEMLERALQYEVGKLFQGLYEQQEKVEAFEDKIQVVLEWIRTDLKKNKAFTRIMTGRPINYCMDQPMNEKMDMFKYRYKEFIQFFDYLLEIGIKQGKVTVEKMFEGRVAILSQIICLVLFPLEGNAQLGIEEQQVIALAHKNIMKLLQE